MITLDTNLFLLLNNLAGRSHIFDLLIIFCGQYLAYLLVGAFLILAYQTRNRSIFWVPLIAALIARLGITELIRFFYHRPRPFIVYPVHSLLSDSAWSFPSGHATFFFALATGVYFSNNKWGILFFLATLVITIARVIAGVHYPSDIFGGMLIGIATVYLVRYFAQKKNRQ